MDNQNTPDSNSESNNLENTQYQVEMAATPVEETSSNQAPAQTEVFKAKKGLPTYLKVTAGIFISICLLLIIAVLPIGQQTVLARVLDGLKLHKAALVVDMLASNPSGQSGQAILLNQFGNVDPTQPDSCAKLWDYSDFSFENLAKIESKQSFNVEPNNDYSKNFNAQGAISGQANFNDPKAAVTFEATGNFDGDKWKELAEKYSKDQNKEVKTYGQMQAKVEFAGAVSPDQIFANLSKFGLFSSKIRGNFDFAIADKTGLNDLQKEGIKDLTQVYIEFLKSKPKDAFSDDTGKSIFKFICQGVEKVTVEGPSNVSFGTGNFKTEHSVRPIVFVLKKDSSDIYMNQLPDLTEKIVKDPKFKEFLKSKYPLVKKLNEASNKLSPVQNINSKIEPKKSDSSSLNLEQLQFNNNTDKLCTGGCPIISDSLQQNKVITQQEYEKSIDDSLKSFDKAEFKKSIEESQKQQKEYLTIENKPMYYYISMEDNEIYGTKMEQKLVPTQKALNDMGDNEYREIFKDGVTIKSESFGSKFGDKVQNIQVPDKLNN